MKAESLRPGDWIIAPFGFGALMFYVVAAPDERRSIEVGCERWLVGDTTRLLKFQLDESGFMYIGRGEVRQYRMPWVHPYERPRMAMESGGLGMTWLAFALGVVVGAASLAAAFLWWVWFGE